jgi:hypothetical protein
VEWQGQRYNQRAGFSWRKVSTPMVIFVSRTKNRDGLILQTRSPNGNAVGDFEETIHPGESGLGFTYEEWEAAVGPQEERRIELTEDGAMRPLRDDA